MFWEYERKNTSRAKALRSEMTPQERKLWYCFLKSYPVKFYRQRPIVSFILDFYCPAHKLAVEIDGGQHYHECGVIPYDVRRTSILEQMGIRVLRFTNTEVTRQFEGVCRSIELTVSGEGGRTPQSPPAGGDSSPG